MSVSPRTSRGRAKKVAIILTGFLVLWFTVAYLIMPVVWKRYAHKHPTLQDIPGITHTAAGMPGDPLNVALIGTEAELRKVMEAASWHVADPLALRSDLAIAAATVLERPYEDAPVSSLYLFGRKEDLAFEQLIGNEVRQRHHVRLWRSQEVDADGRPVWVGAASFDERVGLSHTTGEITHHIAADVDAERAHLFQSLTRSDALVEQYPVRDFHKVMEGRNGGGDPWHTDGDLQVGVINPDL